MTRIYPLSKKRASVLPGVAIGPSFGDGVPSVALSVGAVTVAGTSSGLETSKDSWYPNVAGCVDDANKNGTPLQVEGVTATKKDAVIGFDLASYPAGASVSSALLTLTIQEPPPVQNQTVDGDIITQATENWSETTVRCSSHPASDGFGWQLQQANIRSAVNVPPGVEGNVYDWAANATARTRIAARMGVGSLTALMHVSGVLGENVKFWDKDTGVVAKRPRLTFSWSKTL